MIDIMSDLECLADEIYQGKIKNFILGERESGTIGDGYDLYELTEWEPGDTFHDIDWRLTLPSWPKKIYKVNRIETKELPLVLAVDASPSMLLRFRPDVSKFRLMLKLMAALGFAGVQNHDPVGVTAFGNATEFFLPPRYGKGNIMHAAEILIGDAEDFYKSLGKGRKTSPVDVLDLNECLSATMARVRSQSVVAVISDFLDVLSGRTVLDEHLLSALVARHKENVVFLMLDDGNEFSWSGGHGTVMSRNIETGQAQEVKASHAEQIRQEHAGKQEEFQKYLENQGVDSVVLDPDNWSDKLADFAAGRKTSFH